MRPIKESLERVLNEIINMKKYRNKQTNKISQVSFFVHDIHGVVAKIAEGKKIKFLKFSKFINLYEEIK